LWWQHFFSLSVNKLVRGIRLGALSAMTTHLATTPSASWPRFEGPLHEHSISPHGGYGTTVPQEFTSARSMRFDTPPASRTAGTWLSDTSGQSHELNFIDDSMASSTSTSTRNSSLSRELFLDESPSFAASRSQQALGTFVARTEQERAADHRTSPPGTIVIKGPPPVAPPATFPPPSLATTHANSSQTRIPRVRVYRAQSSWLFGDRGFFVGLFVGSFFTGGFAGILFLALLGTCFYLCYRCYESSGGKDGAAGSDYTDLITT